MSILLFGKIPEEIKDSPIYGDASAWSVQADVN